MEQLTQPGITVEIPTKVISSPESDYSFIVPAEPKTSFAYEDERERYKQEERKIILHNWEKVTGSREGDLVNADFLEDSVDSAFSQIDDETKNSDFFKTMDRTFGGKMKAQRAKEWLSKVESGSVEAEELHASNSKWNAVMSLAKEKIGGRSTTGYAMAASIVAVKEKIGDNIEVENKVADLYINYLNNLPPENARELKFRNILPNACKQRGVSMEQLFDNLKNEVNKEQITQHVDGIIADDITDSDFSEEDFELEPSKLQVIKERLRSTYSEIRQDIEDIRSRVKISPRSMVNGVLKNIKPPHIEISPSTKRKVGLAGRGAAMVGLGASLVISPVANGSKQSQVEDTSGNAGNPPTTQEVPNPWAGSDHSLHQVDQIVESMEAARQNQPTQETVQTSEDAGEQQPVQAEAQEGTQETLDPSRVEEVLRVLQERRFEVGLEEGTGIIYWEPKVFTQNTGSWSAFMHGLGYTDADLYPSGRDLLTKFGLRANIPEAGKREYIPPYVISQSPLYQGAGEAEEAA
ncbi:hypothetical protein A2803_05140 [Candidatus Woesebacteria bacterium RIFCSPHIGHO2_01_FULL_44_21]|uniref:Uncharacterized protein n=1 Tax=Candidatus Woesebacteria bacterium RIFCSPHIGHO2_01_FULL_44_21 TaxID=1802503 RepID=A0A1F7Z1G5_9BACT|nr:MAG: hypothetical protein A2803_05140 [Candidatus Woesebacteria bacterium RIFCSPHIGHO2_01_FULL_44_21]OGM68880.1 MAG: hypothetical protein A2897_01835 [Candidatus Woesebacteria bacterium RIFCSPLOWO2_01_FULL_44_24b]